MKAFTKRQQEIINTSIKLISEGGIQELTIKNLSGEIGISEPAIYRHFESKFDILLALLSYFENMTDQLSEKAFAQNKSSIDCTGDFFESLMNEFIKNPSLTRVIFSEEIFQNDRRLSDKIFSIMKSHQKKILSSIKEGQKNGDVRNDIPKEHVAMIIMGAFRLLITKWRLSDFSFDLKEKYNNLIISIKKLFGKGK